MGTGEVGAPRLGWTAQGSAGERNSLPDSLTAARAGRAARRAAPNEVTNDAERGQNAACPHAAPPARRLRPRPVRPRLPALQPGDRARPPRLSRLPGRVPATAPAEDVAAHEGRPQAGSDAARPDRRPRGRGRPCEPTR